MSEIKLNTWRYGVVPKLHPEAVVRLGGNEQQPLYGRQCLQYCKIAELEFPRWYAVLSLGPPEMLEELRLPDGWHVVQDEERPRGSWMLQVDRRMDEHHSRARLFVWEPTRAECVREINRLLEGK